MNKSEFDIGKVKGDRRVKYWYSKIGWEIKNKMEEYVLKVC